jgi:hypothetical protein
MFDLGDRPVAMPCFAPAPPSGAPASADWTLDAAELVVMVSQRLPRRTQPFRRLFGGTQQLQDSFKIANRPPSPAKPFSKGL